MVTLMVEYDVIHHGESTGFTGLVAGEFSF